MDLHVISSDPVVQKSHRSVPLEDLARQIRADLKAVQVAASNALDAALSAGDNLIAAKARVADGRWKGWLRENCSVAVSTAALYMQLADHRAEIEAEISRAGDLSIRAARRLITKSPEPTGAAINMDAPAAGEHAPGVLAAPAKRACNTERRKLFRRMKLGNETVDMLSGTSLDNAREMDELVILNRGASQGELTDIVKRLVADAAAGKNVSAIEYTKSGAAFTNGHDCGVPVVPKLSALEMALAQERALSRECGGAFSSHVGGPPMKKHPVPFAAIKAMVEYLYDDEKKDFFNSCCDARGALIDVEKGRDHIFPSVQRVVDWLDHVKQN